MGNLLLHDLAWGVICGLGGGAIKLMLPRQFELTGGGGGGEIVPGGKTKQSWVIASLRVVVCSAFIFDGWSKEGSKRKYGREGAR